jgi:hypothetical protein
MRDQDNPNDGSLVPAGRTDLAPIVSTNPLVLCGIADLARLQNVALVQGHPFDTTPLGRLYRAHARLLAIQLRLRHLLGQGQGSQANQPNPPVGE